MAYTCQTTIPLKWFAICDEKWIIVRNETFCPVILQQIGLIVQVFARIVMVWEKPVW